jgi:hypothetical protein
MKHLVALSLLSLAGCDMPAPAMMGADATRLSVDGAAFSVRVNGTRAEAIRTNAMPFPSIGAISTRAVTAMEQASGCRVIIDSLRGDQAVMRADLDCG